MQIKDAPVGAIVTIQGIIHEHDVDHFNGRSAVDVEIETDGAYRILIAGYAPIISYRLPINVGDLIQEVKPMYKYDKKRTGTVIFIDGERVWVRWSASGRDGLTSMSKIEKFTPEPKKDPTEIEIAHNADVRYK